jgi:hypothetical protein
MIQNLINLEHLDILITIENKNSIVLYDAKLLN